VGTGRLNTLLLALVGAGLLECSDGCFRNGHEAARYLVRASGAYIGDCHLFWQTSWAAALQTESSVRAGSPQAEIDFAEQPAEDLAPFFRSLHPGCVQTGSELAELLPWSGSEQLVDVGGGSGGVCVGLCVEFPELVATVVELPTIAALTRRFIAAEGLAERVQVVEGDVVEKPPAGLYDVALCRAYFQVLTPRDITRALDNISAALRADGRLIIVGDMLDEGAKPADLAGFGLFFLNAYENGRLYYESEYRSWLTAAGFKKIERLEQGVLVAQKG
jgi:SAM-dependent methyltransferase